MSIREVIAIVIILGIPLGMLLTISLAGYVILGGFFRVSDYIKNRKNNPTLAIWPVLLSVAGIFVGIYLIYFIVTLRPRWNAAVMRDNEIDSFAGCGRDNQDSYSYKTDEEVDKILKILDISKKDFEKRKNECIKNIQMNSFADCSDNKYPWGKGVDINREIFDAMDKLCEN